MPIRVNVRLPHGSRNKIMPIAPLRSFVIFHHGLPMLRLLNKCSTYSTMYCMLYFNNEGKARKSWSSIQTIKINIIGQVKLQNIANKRTVGGEIKIGRTLLGKVS